jgi:hypothetical protein
VEDDGAVAVDRLGLGGEALELDVARALDATCLVLVRLAHVDQLNVAASPELGHALGRELGVRLVEGGHGSPAYRPSKAIRGTKRSTEDLPRMALDGAERPRIEGRSERSLTSTPAGDGDPSEKTPGTADGSSGMAASTRAAT